MTAHVAGTLAIAFVDADGVSLVNAATNRPYTALVAPALGVPHGALRRRRLERRRRPDQRGARPLLRHLRQRVPRRRAGRGVARRRRGSLLGDAGRAARLRRRRWPPRADLDVSRAGRVPVHYDGGRERRVVLPPRRRRRGRGVHRGERGGRARRAGDGREQPFKPPRWTRASPRSTSRTRRGSLRRRGRGRP